MSPVEITVFGAFLSTVFKALYDKIDSGQVRAFFRGPILDDKMRRELIATLRSVLVLLDNAEEQQITKPAVKQWLDDLRDAVYEADDLLDEIAYLAWNSESETAFQTYSNQVRKLLCCVNPLKNVTEENLKEILGDFKHLLKQKDLLLLREGIRQHPSSQKTPTNSLVDESGVYGRDKDKELIMKLVLDDAGRNVPGLIGLWGIGGVGKTTLAQLVYNDVKVQELFELKAWVFVSDEFDDSKVTKVILKEVGSVTPDTMTSNQVKQELQMILRGKKFLIVLDDMWNERYLAWENLLTPLKVGAPGSKIIVTTRSQSVASIICTSEPHHVDVLNDHDCWSLFEKHAFHDGNSREDLEAIGKKLVQKCRGLPLAAKILGGSLRLEGDAIQWDKVLKSNIWDLRDDGIISALRLSYHYLPSHLKPCFAYCALFPKNYEFQKDELVFLWMAEGYLVKYQEDEKKKELGDDYFDDLVSRSFFQRSSTKSCFIMHDFMHDLATSVSGEFCYRLGGDGSSSIPRRTRHLSCARALKFDGSKATLPLRTFLFMDLDNANLDLLPTLRRLRVLSFRAYSDIVNLPDSIGKMIYLRYLNLSGASIEMLPESVTSLYSLQSLILYHCHRLHILPTNMERLINLCCLDIRCTALRQMPPNLGKLTKLQKLTNFIVRTPYKDESNFSLAEIAQREYSSIKELGQIQHLRGKLVIWNLDYVIQSEAAEACLQLKKNLNELELVWNNPYSENFCDHFKVLESLQPHTNLKCLFISLYLGTSFPHWVGNSSFTNLVSLKLESSDRCYSLPPLGQLASLKDLLVSCGQLVTIGSEFYGNCQQPPFPALEILRFERMKGWRFWEDDGRAFPLLQVLSIQYCPKLEKSLPSHLPSLTALRIHESPKLLVPLLRAPILGMKLNCEGAPRLMVKLLSGLYFKVLEFQSVYTLFERREKTDALSATLEEIEIENYHGLRCFPLERFCSLKRLDIRWCSNFKSFSASDTIHAELASLNSLEINHCSNFVSFPVEGLFAPNLTNLRLFECSKLKLLPQCMQSFLPSLLHLKLEGCRELESFPEGGLPSKLESIYIRSCDKLKFIAGNNDEENAEILLLPSTLAQLTFIGLPYLRIFPDIQGIKDLREIRISNCLHLRSMPERLPPNVKLSISNCPLLP